MVAELIGSFGLGFYRCAGDRCGVDETSLYLQIPSPTLGEKKFKKRKKKMAAHYSYTYKKRREETTLAFSVASEKYSSMLQNVPPSIDCTTNK